MSVVAEGRSAKRGRIKKQNLDLKGVFSRVFHTALGGRYSQMQILTHGLRAHMRTLLTIFKAITSHQRSIFQDLIC